MNSSVLAALLVAIVAQMGGDGGTAGEWILFASALLLIDPLIERKRNPAQRKE